MMPSVAMDPDAPPKNLLMAPGVAFCGRVEVETAALELWHTVTIWLVTSANAFEFPFLSLWKWIEHDPKIIPRDLALCWWGGYILARINRPLDKCIQMYCCEFLVKISTAGALVSSLQVISGPGWLPWVVLWMFTTLPFILHPPSTVGSTPSIPCPKRTFGIFYLCCMFLTCLGLFVCGIYVFSCFCFGIFLALSIIVGLLVCIILLGATFFFYVAFVMGCAILVLVSFLPCLTNNSVWENHVAVGRDKHLERILGQLCSKPWLHCPRF